MNYSDLFIGILLIAIPLLLLIFCYRKYVCNQCEDNMKNLTTKFINKLNEIGSKIPDNGFSVNKEDFFNFSDLFSGPVTKDDALYSAKNDALPKDDLLISTSPSYEQPLSGSGVKKSSDFPPLENDENSLFYEMNYDNLNDEVSAPPENNIKKNNINNNNPSFPDLGKVKDPTLDATTLDATTLDPITLDPSNINLPKLKSIDGNLEDQNTKKEINMKSFFKEGQCNFFNNKCPENYMQLGNFSLEGTSLKCGNVENTKPAVAVAKVKNNNLYEIIILDKGEGYSLANPPNIRIHSRHEEKGFGATANAILNENGTIKSIQIINPGYNYTETPNVLIDPPYMSSECHLCCNF